ncbi:MULTISPECIES: PcfJ domain-containing protein [Vibrio]|uniref:PcfJ domain-containing protein n=1 Tax=Vibrio TaxID=662 RepID=UPI00078EA9A0|nr:MULTISPECIES: PcfJ domain-containing protein [Vibrio]BAU71045.1 hypothetical protein [Vibrio sp. 04Ya108]BBM67694.1 hypothetical protein VA249_43400 [Vibrio alfacsensis]BCN27191.1 hypothetical protein VYA_43830 [Vibrio alfacsensis]
MQKRSIHDYPELTGALLSNLVESVPYAKMVECLSQHSHEWIIALCRSPEVPDCVIQYVKQLVIENNNTKLRDKLESTLLNNLIKDEKTTPIILLTIAEVLTHKVSLLSLVKNISSCEKTLECVFNVLGTSRCRYYLLKHPNTSDRVLNLCCEDNLSLQEALMLSKKQNLDSNLASKIESMTRHDLTITRADLMMEEIRLSLAKSSQLNFEIANELFNDKLSSKAKVTQHRTAIVTNLNLPIVDAITLVELNTLDDASMSETEILHMFRLIALREDITTLPPLMQSYSSLVVLMNEGFTLAQLVNQTGIRDFVRCLIQSAHKEEVRFLEAGLNLKFDDRHLGIEAIYALRTMHIKDEKLDRHTYLESLAKINNANVLPAALSLSPEMTERVCQYFPDLLDIVIGMQSHDPQSARICADCIELIDEIMAVEHECLKRKYKSEINTWLTRYSRDISCRFHNYLLSKNRRSAIEENNLLPKIFTQTHLTRLIRAFESRTNYRVFMPQSTHDIFTIGNDQRHCIYDNPYKNDVLNKNAFIFSLHAEDKPLKHGYTFFCNTNTGDIIESHGFCNSGVPYNVDLMASDFIQELMTINEVCRD